MVLASFISVMMTFYSKNKCLINKCLDLGTFFLFERVETSNISITWQNTDIIAISLTLRWHKQQKNRLNELLVRLIGSTLINLSGKYQLLFSKNI